MTRRRTLLALLVLAAVVAVLIPVLMRSRGADVEIKFVGYDSKGAAHIAVKNHFSSPIAVGPLLIFEPGQNRIIPIKSSAADLGTAPAKVSWIGVPAHGETRFRVPPPVRAPWHAQVEYVTTGGFSQRVRQVLVRFGLATSKPLPVLNTTSEVITNAPPVP
jgi:hypothetical protein